MSARSPEQAPPPSSGATRSGRGSWLGVEPLLLLRRTSSRRGRPSEASEASEALLALCAQVQCRFNVGRHQLGWLATVVTCQQTFCPWRISCSKPGMPSGALHIARQKWPTLDQMACGAAS